MSSPPPHTHTHHDWLESSSFVFAGHMGSEAKPLKDDGGGALLRARTDDKEDKIETLLQGNQSQRLLKRWCGGQR